MLPKFILNYFLLFLITTILSSCDTFIGVSEGPPLPGKRISILAKEKKLSAEIESDLREIIVVILLCRLGDIRYKPYCYT